MASWSATKRSSAGEQKVSELIEKIQRVKRETQVPVTTGEIWHVWMEHPELASSVDFIAAHVLPYWEGFSEKQAVDQAVLIYNMLRQAYPGKRIVIAEFGWPSAGYNLKAANPGRLEQAAVLRDFVARADAVGMDYNIVEAIDQPWKIFEGGVGPYWGLFDFPSRAEIRLERPDRRGRPLEEHDARGPARPVAVAADPRTARRELRSGFGARNICQCCWRLVRRGIRVLEMALLRVGLGVCAGLGRRAADPACVHCARTHGRDRRGCLRPQAAPPPHRRCAVDRPGRLSARKCRSIFRPIASRRKCSKATLDAVATLAYPNFECIIVINNTPDPAFWEPVEEHCRTLGARFKFVREDNLQGFKAGALRLALTQTAPDAEIIGVIDADYIVTSDWLTNLVPVFNDPKSA
jgi:hypothetical protein